MSKIKEIAGDSGNAQSLPQKIGSVHSNNRNRVSSSPEMLQKKVGEVGERGPRTWETPGWTALCRGQWGHLSSERLSSAPSELASKRVWAPQ